MYITQKQYIRLHRYLRASRFTLRMVTARFIFKAKTYTGKQIPNPFVLVFIVLVGFVLSLC